MDCWLPYSFMRTRTLLAQPFRHAAQADAAGVMYVASIMHAGMGWLACRFLSSLIFSILIFLRPTAYFKGDAVSA